MSDEELDLTDGAKPDDLRVVEEQVITGWADYGDMDSDMRAGFVRVGLRMWVMLGQPRYVTAWITSDYSTIAVSEGGRELEERVMGGRYVYVNDIPLRVEPESLLNVIEQARWAATRHNFASSIVKEWTPVEHIAPPTWWTEWLTATYGDRDVRGHVCWAPDLNVVGAFEVMLQERELPGYPRTEEEAAATLQAVLEEARRTYELADGEGVDLVGCEVCQVEHAQWQWMVAPLSWDPLTLDDGPLVGAWAAATHLVKIRTVDEVWPAVSSGLSACWIIRKGGRVPVGWVLAERTDDEVVCSWYVDNDYRDQRVGTGIVTDLVERYGSAACAYVKDDNKAARNLLTSAGWQHTGDDDGLQRWAAP